MTRKELLKLLNFKMPAKYDRWIHAAMLLLIFFGTIMLMSANTGLATSDSLSVVKTIIRQGAFFVAGYIALLFFAKLFTIRRARQFAPMAVVVIIGLIFVCFLFETDYGIQAWIPISLGPLSFTLQPTEFAKIVMIVYIAVAFGNISNRIQYNPSDVYTWPAIFSVVIILMVIKQDDFGTLAILLFSLAMECLLLTQPFFKRFRRTISQLCVVGIVLVCLLSFTNIGLEAASGMKAMSKIATRLQASRNPFADLNGSGWQIVQGLYAFVNGGWGGVGLGNSTQKYGYLPTATTDSVLPIVVEETGMWGFAIILVCYMIIILRLIDYAKKCDELPIKMILIGIASYLFVHFLLNVGGVTGLIPFTGVPLIFISNGGSSFLSAMIALGIAQACISHYNLSKDDRSDLQ